MSGRGVAGWVVGRYVVMPDHVHLFARAELGARSLGQWVQAWKSVTSRRIAAVTTMSPPIWQRDYFDRFLRHGESYSEKWEYVRQNPVRKRLVQSEDDWPWQGEIEALRF